MFYNTNYVQTIKEVMEVLDNINVSENKLLPTPKIKYNEKDDGFTILCDLPGTNKKELNISILNNQLLIEGIEGRYKGKSYNLKICDSYDLYDYDNIEAEMIDGVLKINVKRTSKTRSRNIDIK